MIGVSTSRPRVGRTIQAWLAGLVLGALAAAQSHAEQAAATLTVDDILQSSASHFPTILASIAERRGAEGQLIESEGAFDLVFAADSASRLSGYYDGRFVQGGISRNLPALGTSVYAQYRLSDGDFPIYEDARYTNEAGELKLGVLFSLLRDRDIDDRRYRRIDARLSVREAELDVLLTRIGVQQRALIAYWRWVTAGRTLEVYESLLAIARDRQAGLEEQVRRGAQAEFFLIENQQNITRRETFVTRARRDFGLAANELSLFYRTADGAVIVPDPRQLPRPPADGAEELQLIDPAAATTALVRRPELALLRTAFERAQNRAELAANSLKPRVDFNVEFARDLGPLAEGGPSRDGTDTIVGVEFSVPLQQRTARGRIRQAEAEIEAIEQRRRLQEDQIAVEVRNIILSLDMADELLQLAAEQVDQTESMREAEQRRFDNGASDFFVVNLREETAANARIQFYSADLERHIARANYDAAIMDLPRLGIEE